jgi:hypothetical protein
MTETRYREKKQQRVRAIPDGESLVQINIGGVLQSLLLKQWSGVGYFILLVIDVR